MKVLTVRNVQEALPKALLLLDQEGVRRESRNGPVLLGPSVTTVYEQPIERVLFHPARDANPFYHLYEALWMLAGRNDIRPLAQFAKNVVNYSDDGLTWHGAYGYRWRRSFLIPSSGQRDQLAVIARRLRSDPDDRRCVLQMWHTTEDLDAASRDVPCNVMATFQRGNNGELNLVVFNRSNDIVWGCYGANAVHFSMLLEYMAVLIGCPVGTYTQVSVNWHGYLDTLAPLKDVRPDRTGFIEDPYRERRVLTLPMPQDLPEVNSSIRVIPSAVDSGKFGSPVFTSLWAAVAYQVLHAHAVYTELPKPDRYAAALEILSTNRDIDWIAAARQWVERRQYAHREQAAVL